MAVMGRNRNRKVKELKSIATGRQEKRLGLG